jgi:HEAT repeat protein
MPEKNVNVPFKQIVDALLDTTRPFPPTFLHQFSDIRPTDLREIKKIWTQIDVERRVNLMDDLEDLQDSDTLLSFEDLTRFAISDPEARVRVITLRMLIEYTDIRLLPLFLDLSENDPNTEVKATATAALGFFVYQGEIESLPETTLREIEENLLRIMGSKEPDVIRCSALEALGFSSREEVPALIQNAFATNRPDWQESALIAMGHSLEQRWGPSVLQMLDNPDPVLQLQAIRSAGELELKPARQILLRQLKNFSEEEPDVRAAIIWSLSQIGGERVREALEALAEISEDDDEVSFIEDALENLTFTEDFSQFNLIDVEADSLLREDNDEKEDEDVDDFARSLSGHIPGDEDDEEDDGDESEFDIDTQEIDDTDEDEENL